MVNEGGRADFLAKLDRITIWKRGERRAPHKPLLLLLALGRAYRGVPRLGRYGGDLEDRLTALLKQFGPPRRAHHPEQPFARLPGDGLWEIPGLNDVPKGASGIPRLGDLRALKGGFPEGTYDLVRTDPALALEAAQRILHRHFPSSLHASIRDAVGLPFLHYESGLAPQVREPPSDDRGTPKRDPAFRRRVLRAYQRRCAICEFDVRVEDQLLGLEAAHIMWHAAGGPDHVPNGLALCALHHRALDLGAIGLRWTGAQVKILVSSEVNGMSTAVRQLLDYREAPLRFPLNRNDAPDPRFVAWHAQEVFRRPALPGEPAA